MAAEICSEFIRGKYDGLKTKPIVIHKKNDI